MNTRLAHPREVKTTVWDAFSIEEVKSALVGVSEIYCHEWSNGKPFIIIHNNDGENVTYHVIPWADKTPITVSWADFYNELKFNGLQNLSY